jgi:hypothetical protein
MGKMKLNHVTNSLNNFMPYIKSTQGLKNRGVFDTIEAGAEATAHEVSGSVRDMG